METMHEVVTAKLNNRIRMGQERAMANITKLEYDYGNSRDFISPIGKGHLEKVNFASNGTVKMILNHQDKINIFNLHDNAIRQLSEKLIIPGPYLSTLSNGTTEQKVLAAEILNSHSTWQQSKRFLIRSVGDQVRGVLSDQYRRMHALRIINAFLGASSNNGGVICDALYTDTKLFVEVLMPEPIVFDTPKNGTVAIAFGARLSTSDYGDGALDLRTFTMQGVCLNGMVRESVMRQVHLGGKLPENLILSEQTYELDTKATVSAISDITSQLFDVQTITEKLEEIQDASAIEVDMTKELRTLQKSGRILKEEMGEIEKVLMNNRQEDGIQGESTLWKLTQGITAYSRDAEPKRSRDLQEIAGSLMNRLKTK